MTTPPYDFATGNTNPETFPAEDFAASAAAVIPALTVELNRYPGKLGHERMRRLMAEREYDREGVRLEPEHIVLTNGSMQAITLVAETLCAGIGAGGDKCVVMEAYNYVGTIRAFDAMGIEMVGVAQDAQGMRTDDLADVMERLAAQGRRPRFIYTLATYQNPTGAMMPRARRQELVEIAARHDCVVVEDNCYGDVHFEGAKPPALYALDRGPRQIYICSLSKIFAPGVRLGYLTAAPEMLERILAFRNDAGPNTLAAALTAAYLDGRLWEHVETANAALKTKRDAMLGALESELGNLCSWSHPVGGLFIWLRLPDDVSVPALQAAAEARGVTFADGANFHIHGHAGPYIRLAFGFPPVAAIRDGIAELGAAIREVRGG